MSPRVAFLTRTGRHAELRDHQWPTQTFSRVGKGSIDSNHEKQQLKGRSEEEGRVLLMRQRAHLSALLLGLLQASWGASFSGQQRDQGWSARRFNHVCWGLRGHLQVMWNEEEGPLGDTWRRLLHRGRGSAHLPPPPSLAQGLGKKAGQRRHHPCLGAKHPIKDQRLILTLGTRDSQQDPKHTAELCYCSASEHWILRKVLFTFHRVSFPTGTQDILF